MKVLSSISSQGAPEKRLSKGGPTEPCAEAAPAQVSLNEDATEQFRALRGNALLGKKFNHFLENRELSLVKMLSFNQSSAWSKCSGVLIIQK